MRITVYGTTYDTSHVRTFPTGDPNEPTIFMDQDCRVFVERVDGGKAVVHLATTTEIETLAALYGISELRRATRHTDFIVLPPTHPLHTPGEVGLRNGHLRPDSAQLRVGGLNQHTVPERGANGERFQVRAAWGLTRRSEGGRRDHNVRPLPDLTVLCRPLRTTPTI